MKKRVGFIGLVMLMLLLAAPAAASPVEQTTTAWTGAYFANPNLQGDPAFVRDDSKIDFVWGGGSPGGNVPSDNFSARWTRWMSIDTPGHWTFTTIADNGVRLFVDDNLVIDAWSDHQGDLGQPTAARTVSLNLTQSFHLVRMEYYHRGGNAEAHLLIRSASFPDWRGEYYNNPDLVGEPVFVRNDSAINFNFGTAGPGGGIPGTNFSVRWTSSPYFDAGSYRFTTTTDDGVRLWIDNQLLIDQWHDATPTGYSGDIALGAGNHFIKVEYYQHSGGALAILTWAPILGSEIWHGEYFDNPGLQGTAAFSRDDANINFNWGSAPPGNGVSQGVNWSARWSARRITLTAGYYTVDATADDGLRVWIDGAPLIDEWHDASPTTYATMVYLNAGQHDWRVEYYQHLGTASLRVDITPGAAAPLTLATSAPGDIVIDTQNPNFIKGGDGWQATPNGNGGAAFSTMNSTFAQAGNNWARWYASLSRAGFYEVSVYIPAGVATTRGARYEIAHAGTYSFQSLDQSLYAKQWVSLGAYYFSATGDEYVSLSDVTYEPVLSTAIVADAVRFAAQ